MNADSNTLFTDEEIAAAELMASDFIRDGALEEAADLLYGHQPFRYGRWSILACIQFYEDAHAGRHDKICATAYEWRGG